MKNKILWGITLLPLVITAIAIKFMPDSVPMHYNMSGEVDRWGSKYENFIFPCIIIVMTMFWQLLMRYYRKKQLRLTEEKLIMEARNNEKLLYYVAIGMAVMYTVMQCALLYVAYSSYGGNKAVWKVDIGEITNIIMGFFIIFLGNFLPKAKRNSIMGVTTVWALHNDVTWAKSNRFGGAAFMVCGVLTIIETLLVGGFTSTMIMLGIIIGTAIVVCVYSYKIYKKYKDI